MDGCDLYAFVSDVQVLDCPCGFNGWVVSLVERFSYCYYVMLD